MRTIDLCAAVALCIVPSSQLAADEVSVERGLNISIIGGCHSAIRKDTVKPRGNRSGQGAQGLLHWVAGSLGHDLCSKSKGNCTRVYGRG